MGYILEHHAVIYIGTLLFCCAGVVRILQLSHQQTDFLLSHTQQNAQTHEACSHANFARGVYTLNWSRRQTNKHNFMHVSIHSFRSIEDFLTISWPDVVVVAIDAMRHPIRAVILCDAFFRESLLTTCQTMYLLCHTNLLRISSHIVSSASTVTTDICLSIDSLTSETQD